MDYIRGWFNGLTTSNGQIWAVAGVLLIVVLVVVILKSLNK